MIVWLGCSLAFLLASGGAVFLLVYAVLTLLDRPSRLWTRWTRAVRTARGLCPSCGYDLRASPERCPECGAATPA